MIHTLSEEFSLVSVILKELRDTGIQSDRFKFRRNIERIGEILAYEISKTWPHHTEDVKTPLGIAKVHVLSEQPVIATVLRAGLPLQSGLAHMFDQADLAYISAYRKHISEHQFEIVLEYVASPSIDNRILILCDPMLATGQSLVKTYRAFMEKGNPKKTILASVIGSKEGVEYVQQHIPEADLYIGTIDDELDENGYIIPGLGDAGDLSFGTKL